MAWVIYNLNPEINPKEYGEQWKFIIKNLMHKTIMAVSYELEWYQEW